MSEQLLHGADVVAGSQQMGRERWRKVCGVTGLGIAACGPRV